MGGARKNVLWVDDEIEFLRSHIMFLETRGYSVMPVFSGEEALQVIRSEPRRFDIVLLDEQMPGMDGLTTLEEIKGMLPDLPVVMVTKSEEEQVMETALGLKIDGYLTKPVNPSQILSVCKAILDSPKFVSTHVTQRFVRDYSENKMLLSREMQASDWIRLYTNLTSWDIELEKVDNEGIRQNHAGQRSDCNVHFARFVAERYPQWVKGTGKPPMLSPQVIGDVVAPLVREGKSVRLVVLDSMRLDQYLVIEGLLKRYYDVERRSYFSILPTAPRFARTALFGGAYCDELAGKFPELFEDFNGDENSVIDADRTLLSEGFGRSGISFAEVGEYVRVRNATEASETLDKLGSLWGKRLLVLAVDFFQMLTHGRSSSSLLQDITADESSLRALTVSWLQFSPALQILREMASQGSTVVLTTEHGANLCNRGLELYGAQGLRRNLRFQFGPRITSDERRCLFISKLGQYRLPERTDGAIGLLGIENMYFSEPRDTDGRPDQTQNSFCYGGISMEEMIAPLAILTPKSV